MLITIFLNNILAIFMSSFVAFWNRISILILLFSSILSFNFYYNQSNRTGYNDSWLFMTILGNLLFIFIYFAGVYNLMYGDIDSLLLIGIIQKKFFSNSSDASQPIIPVKSYSNALSDKQNILNDNKNKSGIYRWVNNLNGKSYIGSAISINVQFNEHYKGYKSNKILQQAFLKYGFINFSFQILEYTPAGVNSLKTLLEREQFYFNLFQPEYNILKNAGSSLGMKHSEVTIKKMSLVKKGINNPQFGLLGKDSAFFGKEHSEETKYKISLSKLGSTHSQDIKDKISKSMGTTIYVYDLNYNLLNSFTSATRAGKHFKSKTHTIIKYAGSNVIFRKEYILSFIELSKKKSGEE